MSIELPRRLFEEIVAHARAGAPDEACGVLAGVEDKGVRFYAMRNAEESPAAYRFDTDEQGRVFHDVEERGLDLLAFVHSHTHTEPYPSPRDVRLALWHDPVTGERGPAHPGTRYLIVSLMDEEPRVRAFAIEGPDPVEEDVVVT